MRIQLPRIETTIAFVGVLVGAAGVCVAALQYLHSSPPQTVVIRESDPEMRALVTVLVTHLEKEGKTLVSAPVILPIAKPTERSSSGTKNNGSLSRGDAAQNGLGLERSSSANECRQVDSQIVTESGERKTDQQILCRDSDGNWNPYIAP